MMLVFCIVLYTYHTHIRCPNYCHDMCMCQAIVIQKSLKLTFIHPVWRFDCFYALNLCKTASMTEVFWNMLFADTPHIFGLPTTAIACVFVKQQTPKKRSNTRLYTRARELASFMLSTCAKLLRWCWYFGICCTPRYPTHIRSLNYYHHMCICQAMVIQESLKLTFVHPGSRIDCFYALNLCQTASMMEVFWIKLYTGIPHIFGLPTTVIACVCVKQQTPKTALIEFIHSGSRSDRFYAVNVCQTASMMKVLWIVLYTGTPHIFGLSTTAIACVFVKE
jgi:hypothetical protein